ncbi:hypothetical protein CUMW_063040 [Citrus unshiu]|nr:hypothetical protein CUMW_063040 [Citrus unshiu]
MARLDSSDSEPEESENLSSEEEESEAPNINSNGEKEHEISAYEKQRLSRIAENKARMEAMGLSKLASSLMEVRKLEISRRVCKFQMAILFLNPLNIWFDSKNTGFADVVLQGKNKSSIQKKKSSTRKKKATIQKQLSSSDCVAAAADDDELMQAIALSLQPSEELSAPTQNGKKGIACGRENTGMGKRKKSFTARVKMTEDEVILHFFQFNDAGKGSISLRDLRRVSVAHDFIWTDDELFDMIHCFDSDGDGKLNLEDFQKIVSRCNMI